jgi:hypothetical protein
MNYPQTPFRNSPAAQGNEIPIVLKFTVTAKIFNKNVPDNHPPLKLSKYKNTLYLSSKRQSIRTLRPLLLPKIQPSY